MGSLRPRVISVEHKVENQKIVSCTEIEGITVDDLHRDLSATMEEYTPTTHEQFPEGAFKWLFWKQQREALKCGYIK